jgi:GGDEF domain-containing protein
VSGPAQTLAFLRDAEESFELDQEGALRHAATAEEAGRATGDVELELRGQALLADVWLRRTDSTGDATQLLRTVEFRAAEHGLPLLQARAHRLLSRVAANMGDFAGQLDHALRGLELLPPQAAARLRIMHLMALSEALFRTRSAEAAVRRYAEAEEVALAAGDTLFRSYILNDLAYCLYASGQPARAEAVSARLLAALEHEGRRPIPPMLDTLARIQLALGRTAEAVRTAQQLVAHAPEHDEYPEGAAEAALTLAAAHHQAGSLADAQAALDRAGELTAAPELARVRVNVLREQAELHATRGDFQAAFTTYKAFHEASEEISSREREAQARIRQTAFETAEARRDAERFREESLRDPLTGLRNRRYVDAQLPRLLAGGQLPLVAAIVDIDHFKMINDSCSHEIGDQVLVVIAGLLGAAVPSAPVAVPAGLAATPSDLSGGPAGHVDLALGAVDGAAGATGFAARLGGEEFLIVLVGPGSDALARLERLREAVAGHPWHFLTGDLPVTVSIGAAAAQYPQRPADLLGAADRNLYTAKRGGRNRLCAQ